MDPTTPTRIRTRRRRTTIVMTPVGWGLLAAFILFACITAYLTFVTVRAVVGTQKGDEADLPKINIQIPQQEDNQAASVDQDMPMQADVGPTPEPWDGSSRVNILVMGLDYRDWEGGGPSRTDTMILFTLDPVSHTAGMLSLPRDLWVNIPGYDYGKLNTAYYLGEAYDEPGGGPGLAILTVEQFLGVPINYYAQVDFYAFERLVDEIGGVEIDVPEEITVDPLGPGNTVTLDAGLQTLDGPTALAYARNRDTFGGDFDRAQRQQQVILAIRDKVLSLDMLPLLIKKAPSLYKALSSSVNTNLTLNQAIQLGWEVKKISVEGITRRAIGVDQVTMSYSPDGMDILVPDSDAIRALRDEVFTNSGPIRPVATEVIGGDPEELMKGENAALGVLNGTDRAGLASDTTQYLQSLGLNVPLTGNAQQLTPTTLIIDYTGKPYTRQYLIDLLQISSSNIYFQYDPNNEVDIAIILGEDWAENNPMP